MPKLVRRIACDTLIELLALLPFTPWMLSVPFLKRLILWSLFHLQTDQPRVARVGPSFCRFKFWLDKKERTDFLLGTYEQKVTRALRRILKRGDVAIDIGAHVGYHAILMAQLVGKNGTVLAFEPFPENFDALERNIELNNLRDTVRPEPLAVTDSDGCVSLAYECSESLAMTPSMVGYAVSGAASRISVPACRLDCYLEKVGKRPSLIQIDVEGAELHVLRGARNTLERLRPTLLVEVHGWDGLDSSEVCRFLSPFGYRPTILGERGREAFVLFAEG